MVELWTIAVAGCSEVMDLWDWRQVAGEYRAENVLLAAGETQF